MKLLIDGDSGDLFRDTNGEFICPKCSYKCRQFIALFLHVAHTHPEIKTEDTDDTFTLKDKKIRCNKCLKEYQFMNSFVRHLKDAHLNLTEEGENKKSAARKRKRANLTMTLSPTETVPKTLFIKTEDDQQEDEKLLGLSIKIAKDAVRAANQMILDEMESQELFTMPDVPWIAPENLLSDKVNLPNLDDQQRTICFSYEKKLKEKDEQYKVLEKKMADQQRATEEKLQLCELQLLEKTKECDRIYKFYGDLKVEYDEIQEKQKEDQSTIEYLQRVVEGRGGDAPSTARELKDELADWTP